MNAFIAGFLEELQKSSYDVSSEETVKGKRFIVYRSDRPQPGRKKEFFGKTPEEYHWVRREEAR